VSLKRQDVIGRGWAFPFRFTGVGRTGNLVGVSDAASLEKIAMSIRQILSTRIGSRVMDRDFGTELKDILFTPIDEISAARVRFAITDALQRWERRIQVTQVDVSIARAAEGVIDSEIFYLITATQQEGNLVYPLYITEDMVVQGQINV
jgi:phage baseplate assembly protein W